MQFGLKSCNNTLFQNWIWNKKGIHNDCKSLSIAHSITDSKILRGTYYKFILLTTYIILIVLLKKKHNTTIFWDFCVPQIRQISSQITKKCRGTCRMSHFLPKIISGFNLYSSPNNTIIQSPYYFLSAIAAECYIPNHINLICMCCLYLWR